MVFWRLVRGCGTERALALSPAMTTSPASEKLDAMRFLDKKTPKNTIFPSFLSRKFNLRQLFDFIISPGSSFYFFTYNDMPS